jgi:hypothetical protein
MQRILRAALVVTLFAAAAAPAGAKIYCGRFAEPDGRFYLLKGIKKRAGAYGPVTGYLVGDGKPGAPVSGHYLRRASNAASVTLVEGVQTTFLGYETTIHNIRLPTVENYEGTHFATTVGGVNGVSGQSQLAVTWVDCREVPPLQ